MRPEPRPDIIDISPRAEAGDQFFVEEAEKNKPFPNIKPKSRPDLDKDKGRTYDIYSIEIDGRETNVIEFKDGSRLSIPQIEQMFEGSKSATESTPGKQTTKEIINFLENNNPTKEEFVKHFTAKRLNRGGAIMDEQMQMAFMNEGGLTDDGMDKDPVSGNDVPSGSLAEEVRDNIPAQLSEGEYVVPADVVRYYGVKFFEDLRDNAKMGLQEMEMNGRIGGEPVPAGGPTNTDELSPQEMQAIQEMMGMAEGGEVQNPYMQQQLLYSQPRPVSMDEQNKAIVDSINPVENQMPMQTMAEGGEVRGYAPGGLEQSFLNTGQQAVNRGFVGFPLGSTIFPSEKTGQTALGPVGTQVATTGAIDTAITGTAGTDTSMLTTVTLYGPNGEVVVLTLPTDQDRYDQLINEDGYSTTAPVEGAPVVKSGADDPVKETIGSDSSSWMDKFDYDNLGNLGKETANTLKKSPFGASSVIGAFMNGQNAAEAAANIIILDANTPKDDIAGRKEVDNLKTQWSQFINNDILLKNLPQELINGDKLAKEIVLNNPGKDIGLTYKDKKGVTTKDLFGNDLFKDENDFNNFMQKTASEGMTFDSASRSYKREGSPSITTATSAVRPKIRPETVYNSATSKTLVAKPPAPKAPPVKTQAQKDTAAKAAINDWVAATQATKGKKGIDRHKAIKAQSAASKKATKAIQEKTGRGFFKEGGLMAKGKKK